MENELMNETISESLDYIPKLMQGILKEIHYINTGEYAKALALLNTIIEGIEWSIEAIMLTSAVHGYNIGIERINESLIALTSAIENKDYQLLSDILKYEIAGVLNGYIDHCREKGLTQ